MIEPDNRHLFFLPDGHLYARICASYLENGLEGLRNWFDTSAHCQLAIRAVLEHGPSDVASLRLAVVAHSLTVIRES